MVDTYTTAVYYHWKSPKYNETIRLSIEPSKLDQAIIVFLFSNIPSRHKNNPSNLGVGYLKLTDTRGLIPAPEFDSTTVYKYQKSLENDIHKFHKNAELRSKLHTSTTLSIRRVVVSTKVTQNPKLKNLLNWTNVKGISMEQLLRDSLYIEMDEKMTVCCFGDMH